jgi:hypothetical protein
MGRIEERRARLEREQSELDEALADWVQIPDAAATARLMKAAKAYLGINE